MIKITEDLYIIADKYQYIVGTLRERADKAGNLSTVIDNPAYCSTMESAITNCLTRTLRKEVENGDIETLYHFLNRLETLTIEIGELISPLGV